MLDGVSLAHRRAWELLASAAADIAVVFRGDFAVGDEDIEVAARRIQKMLAGEAEIVAFGSERGADGAPDKLLGYAVRAAKAAQILRETDLSCANAIREGQ